MDDNPIVMDQLLNSSSSSSSSEDEQFFNKFIPEVLQHQQKNELYAENIVTQYSDTQFIEHFKVPRQIVVTLAAEFQESPYYPTQDTGFPRIPAEKCIIIFCWYATHEAAAFRNVADRFNVTISTLHLIIYNVAHFNSSKSGEIITWPTNNEKLAIVEDFAQLGFPNVLGCVDGSHIRIDKPEKDPESYLNRKKYYSIQIQAVCDSKRRITDVFIGWPGSAHDARVFANSSLSTSLADKCEDKFLLADSAYPCLRNMLTPYKDNGHLSATERNFNQKLSHCRILIEHTFGLLKQRFRQLYHVKLRGIELLCHFVRACCVLHNMILKNGEIDEGVENEEVIAEEVEEDPQLFQENEVGHNFRNYVAALLYNQ